MANDGNMLGTVVTDVLFSFNLAAILATLSEIIPGELYFTCSRSFSVTVTSFFFIQAQAMVEIVKQLGWSYVSTVAAQVTTNKRAPLIYANQ